MYCSGRLQTYMNTAVCKLLLFDRVQVESTLKSCWLFRYFQLRKNWIWNCCQQQRPGYCWRWYSCVLHSWWSTCQEQWKLMREVEMKRSGEVREDRDGKESYGSEGFPWICYESSYFFWWVSEDFFLLGFWGCYKVGDTNSWICI